MSRPKTTFYKRSERYVQRIALLETGNNAVVPTLVVFFWTARTMLLKMSSAPNEYSHSSWVYARTNRKGSKTTVETNVAGVAPYCQGPDPNPKHPRLKVPPGATDTHFHILGPAASYPYVAEREYTPPDALASSCRHLFDTLGIQRAVLIQPSVCGEDNLCMEDSARKLGMPTRMVVVLPFSTPDKELGRLHDAGARAVRFILAHIGGLPLSDLERFSARIKDMGWHVQFLLRPANILDLESRLTQLSTEFVIDHMGLIRASEGGVAQPAFQALLRLLRTGRCWVKLTGGYRISSVEPPYPDVIPLVEALVKERPDRILWGSDWPHVMVKTKMPNTTDLLDVLLDWVPDEKVRTKILVDNPQALFRFESGAQG